MKIAVIGLGAMGLGIAQVFAQAGHEVWGTDSLPAARDTAPARMAAALAPRLAKGTLSKPEETAILARFHIAQGLPDLVGGDLVTDLVIEAASENLALKQALLRGIETLTGPQTILASNTSSLPIAAIARGLARPERLLGLHFFNPAPVMKLVEVIPHAGTTPDALERARALAEAAGKTVVLCPDRPGFIVNRCARPYYGEALALLEEGRSAAHIDAAMQAAGYRLGPFALIDLVGADINLAATESLAQAMAHHPRYHVFAALKAQVARGDLGRKSGRGFLYPDAPSAPLADMTPDDAPDDAPALRLRIEAALVNEAGWLLAEGGCTEEGIDTALRLGLNFPRGPFGILAREGKAQLRAELARLEAQAPPHLRGRYAPAPLLA